MSNEEITTERTALPGGIVNRLVARGDTELRSGGGLPVVAGEGALSGEQVSRQSASIREPLPSAAFAGRLLLTRAQSNPLEMQLDSLLTREQEKQDEAWLKSLLPSLSHGWWDVAKNGKGFVIKQRWRDRGQQTQTYPRVSREQFTILKEKEAEDAKSIIEDAIIGHVEECLKSKQADKRARAGCAAERLGLKR